MAVTGAGLSKAEKVALIEDGLMRAAEQIGDINEPVMARFYARIPEARESFEYHSRGSRARLEAEMMDNVLYCIMTWFASPEEIRILLMTSVPHHQETLKVDADWYEALLAAGVEVIAETVPSGANAELALWREMGAGFARAIDIGRKAVVRDLHHLAEPPAGQAGCPFSRGVSEGKSLTIPQSKVTEASDAAT